MSGSQQKISQQKLILRHIEKRLLGFFRRKFCLKVKISKMLRKGKSDFFILSLWETYRRGLTLLASIVKTVFVHYGRDSTSNTCIYVNVAIVLSSCICNLHASPRM